MSKKTWKTFKKGLIKRGRLRWLRTFPRRRLRFVKPNFKTTSKWRLKKFKRFPFLFTKKRIVIKHYRNILLWRFFGVKILKKKKLCF